MWLYVYHQDDRWSWLRWCCIFGMPLSHMWIICVQANPLRCVSLARGWTLETFSPFPKVVSLSMPCALATLLIAFRAGRWWWGDGESFQSCYSWQEVSHPASISCRHLSMGRLSAFRTGYVNRASEFPAISCNPDNRLCSCFTNPSLVRHIRLVMNHVGWMNCRGRSAPCWIRFLSDYGGILELAQLNLLCDSVHIVSV